MVVNLAICSCCMSPVIAELQREGMNVKGVHALRVALLRRLVAPCCMVLAASSPKGSMSGGVVLKMIV